MSSCRDSVVVLGWSYLVERKLRRGILDDAILKVVEAVCGIDVSLPLMYYAPR